MTHPLARCRILMLMAAALGSLAACAAPAQRTAWTCIPGTGALDFRLGGRGPSLPPPGHPCPAGSHAVHPG